MNIMKKIILTLMLMMIILMLKSTTCNAVQYETLEDIKAAGADAVGNFIYTGDKDANSGYTNEVYCAQQQRPLGKGDNYKYQIIYYLEITEGNKVLVRDVREGNYHKENPVINELRTSGISENKNTLYMTTILSHFDDSRNCHGDINNYSKTQRALWKFLLENNEWFGTHFGEYFINTKETNNYWQEDNYYKECTELADNGQGFSGSMRIWLIAPPKGINCQSLMLVDIGDNGPEKTELSIKKMDKATREPLPGAKMMISKKDPDTGKVWYLKNEGKTETSFQENIKNKMDSVAQYVEENNYTYKGTKYVDYQFPISNYSRRTLSCSSYVQECLLQAGFTQLAGGEKMQAYGNPSTAVAKFKEAGIEVDLLQGDQLSNLQPGDIIMSTGYWNNKNTGEYWHTVIVYDVNGQKVQIKGVPEVLNGYQGYNGVTYTVAQLKSWKVYALRIKNPPGGTGNSSGISVSRNYSWTQNKDEATKFTTDSYGYIRIYNLEKMQQNHPDQYMVYTITEIEPPEGYKAESSNWNQEQYFSFARENKVEMWFENVKSSTFKIIKKDSATEEKLAGAEIKLSKIDENNNRVYLQSYTENSGKYTYNWTTNEAQAKVFVTDKNGEVVLYGLQTKVNPNSEEYIVYTVHEVKAPSGYIRSEESQAVSFKNVDNNTLIVWIYNDKEYEGKGGLVIYKRDSHTKESLEGFGFVIMREFHEEQKVTKKGESLEEKVVWKYLKIEEKENEKGEKEKVLKWIEKKDEDDKKNEGVEEPTILKTDATGRIFVDGLPVTEKIYAKCYKEIPYIDKYEKEIFKCSVHNKSHKGFHYIEKEQKIKYKIEEVYIPDDNYKDNLGNTKVIEKYNENTDNENKVKVEVEEFTLDTVDTDSNEYKTKEVIVENEPKNPMTGNVKISGKVWLEEGNGKDNNFDDQYGPGDKLMSGVKVYWKAANGTIIAQTQTDINGKYEFSETIKYEFCQWKMDTALYNKLNSSYIEFEYDGQKYTTVANTNINSSTTSRAKENVDQKTKLDNSFAYVKNEGPYNKSGNRIKNYTITANTKHISNILSGTNYQIERTKRYGCLKHEYVTTENGSYHVCKEYGGKVVKWNVKNVNLGLVKKEQPDLATASDIAEVDVIMKGQQYKYKHGNRGQDEQTQGQIAEEYYELEFGKANSELYERPVNPADISYINTAGNKAEDLEIYITYHLVVKNQSQTLYGDLKEIVNYYDKRLDIVDVQLKNQYDPNKVIKKLNEIPKGEKHNDQLNKVYITALEGELIAPGHTTPIIAIKYKVNTDTVKKLISENILLENLSEITSYASYYSSNTITSEHKKAPQLSRDKKLYSGLDSDSKPGNVGTINFANEKITKVGKFEDDTDVAPTFKLKKDDIKTISGTVWEDSTDLNANARIGDGKNDNERGVENVKVELLKVKDDGTTELANLYSIENNKSAKEQAVTWTNYDGKYTFEGVVVDNYIIKYTYGGSSSELGDATKIKGNSIDARNYKSTIVNKENNNLINALMHKNIERSSINQEDLLWHLTVNDNVTTAVDDIDDLHWVYKTKDNKEVNVNVDSGEQNEIDPNSRLAIDSLKNRNFTHARNVSAYTLPFKIQVEYTKNQYYDVNPNGERNDAGNFENNWNKFNFGIAERAREDIVVEKTIEKLRIVLANGQVLVDGDPYSGQMNYVRALGENSGDKELTRNFNKEKAVFMEMDSELIQGATLELIYRIKVRNNSEVDYEYNKGEGGNEKYYYYGDIASAKIKQSVEYLVDYVDKDLTCEAGDGTKNAQWEKIDVSKKDDNTPSLEGNGQISKQAKEAITTGNYKAFITKEFTNIASGEEHSERLYVSKLLGNQEDDHVYENHVEIVQLNGKIARTIDSTENGKQMGKKYIPGNYEPSLSPTHEQDDSSIKLTITPPTGLPENIKLYIIVGSISLIVIAGGIVIIKRKIL